MPCLRCSDCRAPRRRDAGSSEAWEWLARVSRSWAQALRYKAPPRAPSPRQKKAPPKPQNVVSPDAALDRLMDGNARYVQGVAKRHDFRHEREPLSKGQNPYAAILSCADSRIAPEYAFDRGAATSSFAGSPEISANDDVIASLEYSVAILNTPLDHGARARGLRGRRRDDQVA